MQCVNCRSKFHKKCANQISKTVISNFTTYSGVRLNQWVCHKCNNTLFPFSNLNDEELLQQYSSTDSEVRPILRSSNELNTDMLNSVFCGDDELDVFLVRDQYIDSADILNAVSTDRNSFRFLCVNVRSLVNNTNFSKLEALVSSLSIRLDVIAVTETWIQSSSAGPFKNLKGSNFISNNRLMCRGGGVGLYIKDNLVFSIRDDLTLMREKIFESIFIEVIFNEKTVTYGAVYRSPFTETSTNVSFLTNLNGCLSKILPKSICIVGGDFNYNLFKQDDRHVSAFVDATRDNAFCSMINKPTRITDTTAAVLDQIWTNIQPLQAEAFILLDPLADHLPVLSCNKIGDNPSKKNTTVKKIFFPLQNQAAFKEKLNELNIFHIIKFEDVDEAFNLFMTEFNQIFNECFPFVTMKVNSCKSDWYDKELKQQVQ